ncbi:MAG: hypothetical protein IPK13_04210 [Deltaproteobacteria bacterium]|nr:hypothetical protein [Deltaproteobacteria bacterium]
MTWSRAFLGVRLATAVAVSMAVLAPGSAPAAAESESGGSTWTLDNLGAALKDRSYAEILDRALDVPATNRTDAWRSAVAEAAAAVIRKMTPAEKKPLSVVDRAAELVTRFEFLESAPAFAAARGEVIVAALRRCWDADDQRCLRGLEVHTKTLSGKAALDAAKVLQRGSPAWSAASFIKQAVSGTPDLCKEALVSKVALSALGTPEDQTFAADARRVAFELCWDDLKPALKAGMVGASNAYLKNACKSMREKKALSELQDEICREEDL